MAVEPRVDVRLLGPLEVEVSGERCPVRGRQAAPAVRGARAARARGGLGGRAGRGAVGRRAAGRCRAGAAEADLAPPPAAGRRRVAAAPSAAGLCAGDRPARRSTPAASRSCCDRARVALGRDDPERAAADLNAALAMWRGEALADYRFDEFAQREIARLEELRLEAVEERLAAELARGGAEEFVGELQALVAEHPLRERLRGHLMVALYRAGRQAEALETMRSGRRLLGGRARHRAGPGAAAARAHDPRARLRAERRSSRRRARGPACRRPRTRRSAAAASCAEVGQLLVYPDMRLVTLVGPGGVGKTRIALEAGAGGERRAFPPARSTSISTAPRTRACWCRRRRPRLASWPRPRRSSAFAWPR